MNHIRSKLGDFSTNLHTTFDRSGNAVNKYLKLQDFKLRILISKVKTKKVPLQVPRFVGPSLRYSVRRCYDRVVG